MLAQLLRLLAVSRFSPPEPLAFGASAVALLAGAGEDLPLPCLADVRRRGCWARVPPGWACRRSSAGAAAQPCPPLLPPQTQVVEALAQLRAVDGAAATRLIAIAVQRVRVLEASGRPDAAAFTQLARIMQGVAVIAGALALRGGSLQGLALGWGLPRQARCTHQCPPASPHPLPLQPARPCQHPCCWAHPPSGRC